ncbi:MAG: response regulator [Methanothrix sp.]|nr:response regulator [Methanothrix sp.]
MLNVLIIEDNKGDADLIRLALKYCEAGCTYKNADRVSSGLKLLEEGPFDVVLLDLGLPDSIGLDAIQRIQDKEPKVPIIVLTGLSDKELAARAISLGAQDYLVKGDFDNDLLYRAIRYAIERKKLLLELQETLANVRKLSGMLPICASCKKIRDDKGYWLQVETYIRDHSEAEFTHGICPECARKLYPELHENIPGEEERETDE